MPTHPFSLLEPNTRQPTARTTLEQTASPARAEPASAAKRFDRRVIHYASDDRLTPFEESPSFAAIVASRLDESAQHEIDPRFGRRSLVLHVTPGNRAMEA